MVSRGFLAVQEIVNFNVFYNKEGERVDKYSELLELKLSENKLLWKLVLEQQGVFQFGNNEENFEMARVLFQLWSVCAKSNFDLCSLWFPISVIWSASATFYRGKILKSDWCRFLFLLNLTIGWQYVDRWFSNFCWFYLKKKGSFLLFII